MEVRVQTGLPRLLGIIYQCFLTNGFAHGTATRKSLHFIQRILIDRVQQIYRVNRVSVDDKHIELLVRPMAFVYIIQDYATKTFIMPGEYHSLEVVENTNWQRALKNWQKKKLFHTWEPRIIYKPILFGLTKTALRSFSFLSAASFQETSRVLVKAALYGQIDGFRGLKENLILGTCIPIGTRSDSILSNIYSNTNYGDQEFYIHGRRRKTSVVWLDTLFDLEKNILLGPILYRQKLLKIFHKTIIHTTRVLRYEEHFTSYILLRFRSEWGSYLPVLNS